MDCVTESSDQLAGVEIKAVYGKMRYNFDNGHLVNSDGLVRGFDAAIDFWKLLQPVLQILNSSLCIGGSFRKQISESNDIPLYIHAAKRRLIWWPNRHEIWQVLPDR
jgi:hypothetical protein